MPRPSRPRRFPRLALVLGLASTPLASRLAAQGTAAPAEQSAPGLSQTIAAVAPAEMVGPLILRDTPLDQILELVERYTGRVILRPASLPPGTYTLTLDKPLPKADALRALETVLNLNGVGLSPLGDRFLKVSPLNLIRAEAPEFISGSTLSIPPSGRVAAKLFTLEFLRVAEFVPQISQILSPALGAAPIVFEKNNAVLITDSISTLQRVEKLISTLDQPTAASLGVKTYTIANAKASDLVNKLRTLLSGPLAAQIGTATTYQPDDRTNQVILIADKREHGFFDQLIARLDAEASPNTRSEVIFLKHANATEVSTLLSQLITGQTTASSRESGSGGARTTSRRNTGNNNAPGATPAATPPPAAAAAVNAAAASEEFSSYLTIVADERSNAIVVAGTPNDIKLVASLVDRIDVLLAQVRIEVVIAEVTLKDDRSTGISQLGLNVKDNKLVGFSGAFAGGVVSGSGADTSGNPTGFASVVQNANGSYDLTGIVNFKSSATKTDSSILQTPSIVTTHNEEAEIFVGETRPVISGTTSGASGSVSGLTTSSTIEQQEIGVRLTITPLIGSNGDVQLEIAQTVEDVAGEIEIDGNKQPIISRTETQSYIGAKNGEIIVLGGLQRTTESRSRNRLGPIPIIGDLLGLRSKSKARKELIFFLRPTILTNTALDNVEALKRIDATPIAKEVRDVLDQRPAAAPGPEAPAESPAPASK